MNKRLTLRYEEYGYCLFPLRGKQPAVEKWQRTKFKQYEDISSFDSFGVNLQPDDFVIDVDPRSFKKDDKPHKRLATAYPEIKTAPIVQTGGGGMHIYLKKSPKIKIRKNLKEFQGIDFLSAGCYVVGAGSIHPNSKKYKLVRGDFGNIPQAPMTLLELVKRPEIKDVVGNNSEVDDSKKNQERFLNYLKKAPVAIEGQGGNQTTYKVACRGRDFGLSVDTVWSNMVSIWNERCEPAWDEDELRNIVSNAFKYNEEPAGKFHPSNQFEAVDAELDDTPQSKEPKMNWHLDKTGQLQKSSIHNLCNFFNIYEKTPELHSLIRFNTLSQNIDFTRKPFWVGENETLTSWDDNDANAVMKFLSTKLAFNATKNLIHDAALAVAQEHKYNPVVEYLESLEWDGEPRVQNWLTSYARIEETDYTKAVGELLLRAAIKRTYQAGCKFDYMAVLEGEQGVGKSTLIEILAGKWYADLILNVHSPDTVDCMRNKWIIEVSEMECTKRSETQALKSFLSRRTDTCRLAYARASKDFPRHNIFIGTFNPEEVGTYLKDMTGNRRYLPLTVQGTEFLDFDTFRENVDQLWAEALVMYRANPNLPLYLMDKNVYDQAVKETWERRDADAWILTIAEWLDDSDGNGKNVETTTATEIFTHALGGGIDKLSKLDFRRISNIMVKELKWNRVVRKVKGVSTRVYSRPSI